MGSALLHVSRSRSWRHWLAALAVVVAIATLFVMAIAVASGLGSYLADAYFAVTTAVLPAAWRDEWLAIPEAAHAVLAMITLAAVAGAAAEVLD